MQNIIIYFFIVSFLSVYAQDTINIDDGFYKREVLYFESIPLTGIAYSNYSKRKIKQEAHYIDGKMNGSLKNWYKNGQLKEKGIKCFNSDSSRIKWCGLYQKWYQNGRLNYERKDTLNLLSHEKTWYSNGVLFNERVYLNGKLKESTSWFDNGKIKEKKSYANNSLNGEQVEYKKNGLIYISTYENGNMHGRYLVKKNDSTIIYDSILIHGTGLIKKFNFKGKIIIEKNQTNGVLNSKIVFKKNGKIKSSNIYRIKDDLLVKEFDSLSMKDIFTYNSKPYSGLTYSNGTDEKSHKEIKYQNGMIISETKKSILN